MIGNLKKENEKMTDHEAEPGPGQSDDNYVYAMECGHEWDSPFRRTEGVFVICSVHGSVRLIDGEFLA